MISPAARPLAAFALLSFLSEVALAGDGLDVSCAEVNRAFVSTWSAARISSEIFLEKADGALLLVAETRETSVFSYSKELRSKVWKRYPKLKREVSDAFGPKFTACRLVGEETRQGIQTLHYVATRHEFPMIARFDAWIRPVDGRFVEVRYGPLGTKLKTGPGNVEFFKFDAQASPPPG